ncbi:MAG: zinc metallopeptidase, partial [Planctomycetes bacterium]|nr:zinc metallopeptidase [Planctomycetota bacterium]
MLAFFYINPMVLLYVGPAILLAMWAQMKVKSAFARASRIRPRSGLSGAEAAQRILNAYGITDVAI